LGDSVSLVSDLGLATLEISRGHGNAINGGLVDDLIEACRQAEDDPAVRGLMLASSGKLFCPGLDLQELIEYDRAAMGEFLDRFNRCILALYTFSKPMLARVHGHAIAGGCVLALTADWRVLCEGAMVGLNEVRVGVPFPYGVCMILREAASTRVEEVALFGRNYKGDEAVAAGLVHEIHPAEGFDDHCRLRIQELMDRDARAFSITKRYLRSLTVERIVAHDDKLAHEFLDSWFSPTTQQRLRGIANELRSRSRGE
jgi:enoyl-CoA hydratase